MSAPCRVLVCGSYPWTLHALAAVEQEPVCELVGVIGRRGHDSAPDAPALWAQARDVPHWPWRDDDSWHTELRDAKRPDLVLCMAFPHRIPRTLFETAALGGWNVHPSLLPRWRGADPLRHAILAGDTECGITVHELADEFDAGAVLAQARYPVSGMDTVASLLSRTGALAVDALPPLLHAAWGQVAGGGLLTLGTPQHGVATYAPRVTEAQLRLTPQDSVAEADRKCRAGYANEQDPGAARTVASWWQDGEMWQVLPVGDARGELASLTLRDGSLSVRLVPFSRNWETA